MALEGYKSNHNVVYSSQYHCVWTPKYRRPVLVGPMAKRCEQVIRKTAATYRAEIIALEIMPDQWAWAGGSRPAIRHPPPGQEAPGRFVAPIAARVQDFEIAVAHTVDEPLFGQHSWGCSVGGYPTR